MSEREINCRRRVQGSSAVRGFAAVGGGASRCTANADSEMTCLGEITKVLRSFDEFVAARVDVCVRYDLCCNAYHFRINCREVASFPRKTDLAVQCTCSGQGE